MSEYERKHEPIQRKPTAGPAADDRQGATAPTDVEARILKADVVQETDPVGENHQKTSITIARGSKHGITVDLPGYIKGTPWQFHVYEVHDSFCRARVEATFDAVNATDKLVILNPVLKKPIQRRANGNPATADVNATAQAGVAGATSRLPHFDTIQRAFGKHDISNIQAQVGGPAVDATRALGAHAYATGNTVAFADSPDLHTAAHEAAHVIQQQRGAVGFQGLGAADDEHERHADAVADAVVSGGCAESLLDGASGAGAGGAVQRKATDTPLEVKPSSWVDASGLEHVGSVFFRTKQSAIDAHDRELFDELAVAVAPHAKRNIGQHGKQLGLDGNVIAYADPRPSSRPDNAALSEQRAANVAHGLQRALVAATRLDIGEFRIAPRGEGVAPDAGGVDGLVGEGDVYAPFRRADIFLEYAKAPTVVDKSEITAPGIATGTMEVDGWADEIRLVEQGDPRTIEGVSWRIFTYLAAGLDSQIGADALFQGLPEKPPWWDGRRGPQPLPSSQGRNAQRNADQAKRAALTQDTLQLIRDYKSLLDYRDRYYVKAVEEAKRQRDPKAIEDARRPIRYLHFMYLETMAFAQRIHGAAS